MKVDGITKNFNHDAFLFAYQGPNGPLSASQKQGLLTLLAALDADDRVVDLRHAAYMLATVRHECAGTWQPVAEFGHGKDRPYGKPDPITGQTYYGRGYVQLTWAANYKTMGTALGIDLYRYPVKAMDPGIAYQVMVHGMTLGMFTGVGLTHFIHGVVCDYVNARKIINGLDCAQKIAGYAAEFESILNETLIDAAPAA